MCVCMYVCIVCVYVCCVLHPVALFSYACTFLNMHCMCSCGPLLPFHFSSVSCTSRFVPNALSWYAAFLVKAFPLDMSQYSSLSSSTRIPHQHKDELVTFQDSCHVVVLRQGHLYEVEALQRDGEGEGGCGHGVWHIIRRVWS